MQFHLWPGYFGQFDWQKEGTIEAGNRLQGNHSRLIDSRPTLLGHGALCVVWFSSWMSKDALVQFGKTGENSGRRLSGFGVCLVLVQCRLFSLMIRFFATDTRGNVVSRQTGVIRTNCMDNLDRTNVVQVSHPTRHDTRPKTLTIPVIVCTKESFNSSRGHRPYKAECARLSVWFVWSSIQEWWVERKKWWTSSALALVWGNNADAISILYAGTGALKTDFTRTGKRTSKGMAQDGWNSCVRYVLNNFYDGRRQDAIDLILRRYVPSRSKQSPLRQPPKETLVCSNNSPWVHCVIQLV